MKCTRGGGGVKRIEHEDKKYSNEKYNKNFQARDSAILSHG